jgi:hypothetical protein
MNPEDVVKGALRARNLRHTDVSTVVMGSHRNGVLADDAAHHLCLVLDYKPSHIVLTREEEFALVESLGQKAPTHVDEDGVERYDFSHPSTYDAEAETFTPGLDVPEPGYVTAVFTSKHPSNALPVGEYMVTVDYEGSISLSYRLDDSDGFRWIGLPTAYEFHPYLKES